MSAKGPKGTFWANREILYLDGVFITWVYIFVKMQIMYFKWFHFIEYKLCPLKNIKMLFCGGIYKVIVFPKTFIAPFTRYFQIFDTLTNNLRNSEIIIPFYKLRGAEEKQDT